MLKQCLTQLRGESARTIELVADPARDLSLEEGILQWVTQAEVSKGEWRAARKLVARALERMMPPDREKSKQSSSVGSGDWRGQDESPSDWGKQMWEDRHQEELASRRIWAEEDVIRSKGRMTKPIR